MAHMWHKFRKGLATAGKVAGVVGAVAVGAHLARHAMDVREAERSRQALQSFREYERNR